MKPTHRSILFLLALLLPFSGRAGVAAGPPGEPQLVTFPNPGPEALAELAGQGWDIWQVTPARVTAQLLPSQIAVLQTAGVEVIVLDTQTRLSTAFPACYRTYETAESQLQTWADAYPDLVELIDAGPSWLTVQGRADSPLWTLRVTNRNSPEPKPSLLLVALHHAREIVTPEVALDLAELLLTEYGEDAEITWLVDNREIWIVPFANPDGHARAVNGEDWRKNVNNSESDCPGGWAPNSFGVDLNRNYDYKWATVGASGAPCNLTYHGVAGFSEPETQAIRDLVQAQKFDLVISLHSYSDLILYPWGYTSSPTPDASGLHAIASVLSSFNGYLPEQSSDLYPTSGDTCDWAYGAEGVPCFTFEIGSYADGAFWPDCPTRQEQWLENRDALLHAIKLAADPYTMAYAPVARRMQLQQRGRWLTVQAVLDRETTSPEPPAGEFFLGQVGAPLTGVRLQPADQVLNTAVETMTATVDVAAIYDRRAVYVVGLSDTHHHGAPTAMYFTPCLDVTGDSMINVDDVMQVVTVWHARAGDIEFDSALDLNGNGQIDVQDIGRMVGQWGTSCSAWRQKGELH